MSIVLHGLRRRYKPRQLEVAIFGAIPTLQAHGTPYGLHNSLSTLHVGCSSDCVLTQERVRLTSDSAQRARLDTGGWLGLARQGLSPCTL
jgi:hypothetical protein